MNIIVTASDGAEINKKKAEISAIKNRVRQNTGYVILT